MKRIVATALLAALALTVQAVAATDPAAALRLGRAMR